MRSIRLADILYRPSLAIMVLSAVLQIFCLFVKIFG